MRFTASILIALTLAPIAAGAQDVGVKSGLSFGHVSNSGVLPGDVAGRTGFALGLSVFTPGFLGLGAEGFYAQRGIKSDDRFYSRELEFLDVPVLVRAKIPTPGLAPYAYAGPQLSYELRCESGEGECPGADRPRSSWAGVIGGGVEFGTESAISLEGRYVYGLRDLELGAVTDSESYRDRTFMLLAGIRF